jgi:hypothetical protein
MPWLLRPPQSHLKHLHVLTPIPQNPGLSKFNHYLLKSLLRASRCRGPSVCHAAFCVPIHLSACTLAHLLPSRAPRVPPALLPKFGRCRRRIRGSRAHPQQISRGEIVGACFGPQPYGPTLLCLLFRTCILRDRDSVLPLPARGCL